MAKRVSFLLRITQLCMRLWVLVLCLGLSACMARPTLPTIPPPQPAPSPYTDPITDSDTSTQGSGVFGTTGAPVKIVGRSVAAYRFLTLEQEPLSARAGEGLTSIWLFWPVDPQIQPNHAEVAKFRARIGKLLVSRGDLSIFEFHHQHMSAQTAPRRDASRHEHLWDPQAVTALRLGVTTFPQAVIVGADLAVEAVVAYPDQGLPAFYHDIVQALARVVPAALR